MRATPPMRMKLDPTSCTGHGLCEEMLPEAVELDEWGYPILAGRQPTEAEIAPDLEWAAKMAVDYCPRRALKLQR